MADKSTLRSRTAALRSEIAAWLASDAPASGLYVNLRAMGHATKQDAERWARANEVPLVPEGGKLLARRTDVDAAVASPARERVYYTTSADPGTQHETRAAAAEALRVAMGWKTIALSHDIDVPEVTAFQTEAETVKVTFGPSGFVYGSESAAAPRISRHSEIVRGGKA